MAWSVLQGAGHVADIVQNGLISATFATANLTSGTKLIAAVSVGDNGSGITVTGVSDGTNAFTQVGFKSYANSDGGVYLFALDTPAGDAGTKPTITATTASVTGSGAPITIQEVSGLLAGNTTAMLDGSPGTAAGSTGTSTTSPAYSTSAASEYLVAVYGDYEDAVTTWTNPAGYTGATAGPGSAAAATGANTSNTSNLELAYKNSAGGAETA